jgi:DNA-binding transcriptional regulator YiaG
MKAGDEMTTTRNKTKLVYNGLGFPVVLHGFRTIEMCGEMVPDINYNQLENVMALAVALKKGRLTGNEVKFLRLHLRMNMEKFAELFENTRQAVAKWERAGDAATKMAWPAEKDLRLHVLAKMKVSAPTFRKAFDALPQRKNGLTRRHEISREQLEHPSKFLESYLEAA